MLVEVWMGIMLVEVWMGIMLVEVWMGIMLVEVWITNCIYSISMERTILAPLIDAYLSFMY